MKDKKMMEELNEKANAFVSKFNEKLGDNLSPSKYVRVLFQELYEDGTLGEDRDEAFTKFLAVQKNALEDAVSLAGVALMLKEDEIPDMVVEAFKRMLECTILFNAGLEMIDEEREKEACKDE